MENCTQIHSSTILKLNGLRISVLASDGNHYDDQAGSRTDRRKKTKKKNLTEHNLT